MIPHTYPSQINPVTGSREMLVYFISDITGLTRWVDYIPVRFNTSTALPRENSFDIGGYISVADIGSITGKQAWTDYIRVYVDNAATDVWMVSSVGFISIGTSGAGVVSLNFLSGYFDPRITFSRTSNATLTDSNGRVSYAPHNLLTNSEDFEAAAWTKGATTVTANATTAPDGTITADKIIPTVAAGAHNIYQAYTYVAGVYTLSFYAKAAEYLGIRVGSMSTGNSVSFNLSTGVVGTIVGGYTGSMLLVGNGWYRCTVAWTASAGADNTGFYVLNDGSTTSYTGDGTSGIFIWGAQLNVANAPVNLLTYSEQFDNGAWAKGAGVSVSTNATVAPDGTATADNAVFTSGGTTEFLRNSVTMTAGTSYVVSVYAKLISGTPSFTFDYGNTGTSSTFTPTSEWQRFSFPFTFSGASSWIDIQATAGGTIAFWGAQLNTGSTALPYVATTSSIYLPPSYNSTTPKNLLGYTQEFDNAAWTKSNATVTANAVAAPDGKTTADKLVEDTATIGHWLNQDVPITSGVAYTQSVYAKAGERSLFQITGSSGFGSVYATFNLATGTLESTNGGVYNITPVGNGWYRCSYTLTATTTTALGRMIFAVVSTAASGRLPTYTGDGTSGIYIWGAQLSNSASVDPYVYNPQAAPTSTAYYGPRFDYDPVTLAPKGLLIEEQRTNVLVYSEQFDNVAWTINGATVSANSVVAPDGTTTGDTLTGSVGTVNKFIVQNCNTTTTGAYSASVYLKAGTQSAIVVRTCDNSGANGARQVVNLSNGTLGTLTTDGTCTGSSASISTAGNGWYRVTVTTTYVSALTGVQLNVWFDTYGTSPSVNSFFIWGAQLEAGSFATSYIPTVASQVTRAADNASMLGDNFLTWYNQTQGTVFTSTLGGSSAGRSFTISDGSINNQIYSEYTASYAQAVYTAGSFVVQQGTMSGSSNKVAGAYATNDFAVSVNGGAASVDTSGTLAASYTRLSIGQSWNALGQFNGHIRSITYYPTRLSNATLQGITA